MSYNDFNIHNIAPYKAKQIGVYNNETGERVGRIVLGNLTQKYDRRLYRVGLMSDTHYNDFDVDEDPDSNVTDDGSEYEGDLINAMQFYDKKEDVEFVCVAGDISTNDIYNVKNFRLKRDIYSPNTPIYSCIGNHDNAAAYNNNDAWKQYMSEYDDDKEKIYCPDDPTSFYFVKTLNSGQKDVYIFLSIDYDNSGTSASGNDTDDFISDEERTHQYYNPNTLIWFADILEQFKHNRCFIFTHLFFRQKAGNNAGDYYHYYTNGRSRKYCLRGTQHLFLNDLNNKYKNSIWFTGHSHYPWYYQHYDKKINICNYDSYFTEGSDDNGIGIGNILLGDYKCDSAYNVHLPSLARPLQLSNNYAVDLGRSEGAIMDIYDDYVDIRGIVFKTSDSSEYSNKYCPISTYRIPIGGKNIKQID